MWKWEQYRVIHKKNMRYAWAVADATAFLLYRKVDYGKNDWD